MSFHGTYVIVYCYLAICSRNRKNLGGRSSRSFVPSIWNQGLVVCLNSKFLPKKVCGKLLAGQSCCEGLLLDLGIAFFSVLVHDREAYTSGLQSDESVC